MCFTFLQGLHHLHTSGIIHCDIKSDNVFVGSDGIARIGDFDVSKDLNQRREMTIKLGKSTLIAGTLDYIAPEVAKGELPTYKSDMFSFGIVLLDVFYPEVNLIVNTKGIQFRYAYI